MKQPVRIELERNGRIEARVAVILALAIAVVWFVSAGSMEAASLQESAFPLSLTRGSLGVLAILALVALNALFVASETAVETLRAHHALHAKERNANEASLLEDFYKDRFRYAAACTFGSQVARLVLFLVGLIPAQTLATGFEAKWPMAPTTALIVGAAAVWIPVFLINLILGELVPKSYATLHPTAVATRLGGFIKLFTILFSGPANLVTHVANGLTSRFGAKASLLGPGGSEEEILNLVASASVEGDIEKDERELLESVFEFTDTVAREVMTPRVDLDALSVKASAADAIALIVSSGHSRIPLYEETDDQIVGVVHAKDILKATRDRKTVSLRSIMREPLTVPETRGIREVLTEMRVKRSQMAIVLDEFGGTAGIVTIEDIIEELVGEIQDEYDQEEEGIVRSGSQLVVDGRVHLDDVADELGESLQSEEFDTIGGYVFGLFGRQPQMGESISDGGFTFGVIETDGRRILRISIEKAHETADA